MSTAGEQNDGAASARGDTRRGRADASGDPAARPDTPRNDGPAPLAGIVVVELGASVAAPYAAQTLGDLGAQVWKIEKAEGDDARRWGPPFWEGTSALFQGLNRNKRSVVCDLRDPAQVAALIRFIEERADVVLQNLRPGQAEALGLGAGALTARKPSLVFCNIGAFGAAVEALDSARTALGSVEARIRDAERALAEARRLKQAIHHFGKSLRVGRWIAREFMNLLRRRKKAVEIQRGAADERLARRIGTRAKSFGGKTREDQAVQIITHPSWICGGRERRTFERLE